MPVVFRRPLAPSPRTLCLLRRQATLGRLAWFNLTIGSISIGQNVVFMKFLVGHLRLHYLLGNLISIVGCSLLNFYVSDRIVFQQGSRLAPGTTESSVQ